MATTSCDDGIRRCIYHVPYPLDPNTVFGGQVRPVRMLKALSERYEVWLVAGSAAQRRRQMRVVLNALARGTHFDFCYSESSTMPTALTEPHHLPTHPFQDFAFFMRLRRHGIPVGLFYRDIHWRFPMYGHSLSPAQRQAAIAMYRFDLLAYGACLDVLFLPSVEMANHVDIPSSLRIEALPPGHDAVELSPAPASHPVSLLYVGGFGDNYRMDRLLEAVHETPEVTMTLCTRRDEWLAAEKRVAAWTGENLHVIHANGPDELAPYYADANVAVVAVQPQEYWTFAAPLKVYEYIGNGKPILATAGTLAGEVVREGGLGWTVEYSVEAMRDILRWLSSHPEEVNSARQRVIAARGDHSWDCRVRRIAEVMASEDRR